MCVHQKKSQRFASIDAGDFRGRPYQDVVHERIVRSSGSSLEHTCRSAHRAHAHGAGFEARCSALPALFLRFVATGSFQKSCCFWCNGRSPWNNFISKLAASCADFQIKHFECCVDVLRELKMTSLPVVEGRPLTSEPMAQVAGTVPSAVENGRGAGACTHTKTTTKC